MSPPWGLGKVSPMEFSSSATNQFVSQYINIFVIASSSINVPKTSSVPCLNAYSAIVLVQCCNEVAIELLVPRFSNPYRSMFGSISVCLP